MFEKIKANKVVLKIAEPILRFRHRFIYYYFLKTTDRSLLPPLNEKLRFNIISSWDEFKWKSTRYDETRSKEYRKRFSLGSQYVELYDDKTTICSGRILGEADKFVITLTEQKVAIGAGTKVLYDFYTNETFRGKGFYKTTLKFLIEKFKDYDLIIYTATINVASSKGILAAGFTELGTYTRLKSSDLFRDFEKIGVDFKRSKNKKRIKFN